MSLQRANLRTIDGISKTINANMRRLEADKKDKEAKRAQFLAHIMKEPTELKSERKTTEDAGHWALRAVDFVNNDPLNDALDDFYDELDMDPLDVENLIKERRKVLKKFRRLYGRDTHKYEELLVEAAKANVEFVNKVSHFIDTVRKESHDFLKQKHEPGYEEDSN